MKIVISLFFLFFSLYAQEGVKKVVYDLTTGDIHVFEQKILSGIAAQKSYYEANLEELSASVVIHGDAYKFFINDLKDSPYKNDKKLLAKRQELQKRLRSLADIYQVEFLMCDSGRKKKHIEEKTLYPFVKIVPNAAIGLINKQNEGYAYLPVSN